MANNAMAFALANGSLYVFAVNCVFPALVLGLFAL